MATTKEQTGSAAVQGDLWGARAVDWAEVQERAVLPLYESVLEATGVGAGEKLLDVGCGAGLFCELAAARGAAITGIDAAEALIEIARRRVPDGDFTVGEIEALPYDDHSFEIVTGFNAFQFAANPENALRQARRVARAAAPVVIATWGRPEDCEAASYLQTFGSLMPPPPRGAPGPFALSDDGALEALVSRAGLTPADHRDVECVWEYPDEETALRGLLSAGPAVKAIRHAGEERVARAVRDAIGRFRTASGGYRLENRFRYLIATA